MDMRTRILAGGVIALAAAVGVATSQQPSPPPEAATQVSLLRSRADSAALAQARQDPLAARLRGVLVQGQGADFMRRVEASDVPGLVPAEPALLATAEFSTGDRYYMLTVRRGEQIIEIYGATKAFQSPLGSPAPATAVTPTTAQAPRIAAARLPGAAASAQTQAAARGLTNVRAERTEYGVDVS